MATTIEYIEYICEQIKGIGEIRYKKMFGEFMVYVNEKPVITVCNNTAFVKKLDSIQEMMQNAETGFPYKGAKEHYILDVDESDFCQKVVSEIEKVTPLPKPRKSKPWGVKKRHLCLRKRLWQSLQICLREENLVYPS